MTQYRFKRSFTADSNVSQQMFDLLEIVFSGITDVAEEIKKLGASWESASTPFIYFHNDIAISHVGVLEIPMQIMNSLTTVGGIHGVATHPEFRRQGYYRKVMEEVLSYCDQLYQTLILTTPNPEFYTPFGFRVIPEYRFQTQVKSPASSNGFRVLNTADRQDVELLHRLLETRSPVSHIVGIVNEKPVFCFNEGSRILSYAADLDLITCMNIEDNTLHLFDIVATHIPPLKEILSRIPDIITQVFIYFTPDRLELDNIQALPYQLEDTVLMVRGKFAAEGQKLMLPRSGRC
ncbi:GNAT family N-acetyltransferase [Nostoc sp. FACHB-152]|uniref:GNAT family N-acetyltransferase n=1 Tax=unclassified Nostoc TaxID=2593658 RepID=UPI0016824D53|nr:MULTISPECIES: GNAT family N-acetyltransferase [unclassified Nostoc]MBD2451750.1 GNAT family N-acetyltransferase [Nostoc sp. FACHB-152]MBD2472861.1 GNAT family N-acetyltransferase [Nostoc sp. FACHB-145]